MLSSLKAEPVDSKFRRERGLTGFKHEEDLEETAPEREEKCSEKSEQRTRKRQDVHRACTRQTQIGADARADRDRQRERKDRDRQ